MRYLTIALLLIFSNLLAAQDYGDAPASYGLAGTIGNSYQSPVYLGATVTQDSTNPVTPAWTGDSDDGIVGSPVWNSWSSFNQLTVHIEGLGYLYMFVDADDSGTFEQSELYTYGKNNRSYGPLDVTFKGIQLMNPGGYSLNGANKVAVRIFYVYPLDLFTPLPEYRPDYISFHGEVEDWLVDVAPRVLTISEDTLNDAEEGQSYGTVLEPLFGAGPYTWTQTGGPLPTGLLLTQVGDNFELSSTPAVGSAGVYSVDVQVTDNTSAVATQSFSLRVLPPPYALPFTDSFSTDKHWTLGNGWGIGAATGFTGSGQLQTGYTAIQHLAVEPTTDYTPGNTDNMVLMSSPGATEPDRPWEDYAVSPKIDCTGINNVQLEFRRWYSILVGYDWTAIEITSDGVVWDEVWIPPQSVAPGFGHRGAVADVIWTKIQVDISQWAANKPWIRIRWRIGASIHDTYRGGPYPFGQPWSDFEYFMGWAIDEVVVRETPMEGPLTAHGFEIVSPGSFQHIGLNQWLPIAYPGTNHDWTVLVDNPTSQPVTISSIEARISPEPVSIGASQNLNVNQALWFHIDGGFDWGTWTLAQPVTIPANTSNVRVTGKFDFQGAPANFALLFAFQAYIDLIGTYGAANTPVELHDTEQFAIAAGPMPGMYLHEFSASGTPIDNGQTAANSLRDFGSIAVNGYSWLNIIIDHTSSGTLNLGTPTITGPDAGEFGINTSNYATQLVGNAADTYFRLEFEPTSAGQKTATVTFTHDAPNTGTPFTFEITGFGVGNGPVLKVFEDTITGAQMGNSSPAGGGRDFGQVDIVAGAGQLTIAIENQGNQDLALGTPTITGAGASEFSLNLTGMLTTVATMGSTSFIIDFDPSAIGVFDAIIEFTHNDIGTAKPFVINITGEGIILAPIIEVREGMQSGPIINPGSPATGSSRDFGTVTVGTGGGLPSSIFIINTGWADLVLGTPILTGTNAASFSLDLSGYSTTLTPGSYSVITVNFDPLAKGLKAAMLEFIHNDTNVVSPFTLELKGIGDDPNGVIVTSDIMLEAREGNFYSDQLQAS
ncbi:MAG: choice-of-anchor D domain-containing protein, partial [Planctomycetes bacterium]|nr:choice-of-anchor D domain-containing protein [Planctomycetota bacterium]